MKEICKKMVLVSPYNNRVEIWRFNITLVCDGAVDPIMRLSIRSKVRPTKFIIKVVNGSQFKTHNSASHLVSYHLNMLR